ncbi:MAG: site-2 protease family protein [Clostridiales bacterium]|nr:site-2 protease family protein [Candidatus Cacconaster stercorequi]
MIIYILAAILVFGVLIAVHELGHFLAARACGVRVNEFSIGMGPALWQKQKGDTLYAWRLFPVGGYCAMEGEEEDSDDPAALNNQGFWQKLLIFAAGAIMNFLTGLLIILLLYAGVKELYTAKIAGFAEGCPLESESGLQVGDEVLSVDGERIYIYNDLGMLLSQNTTGKFDLVVRRGGEKVTLNDFPMEQAEYPSTDGGTYVGYGLNFGKEEATVGDRLRYSWNNAIDFVRLVRMSLQMIFRGDAGIKDMSGPVGIVSTMTEVGEQAASVRDAVDNIAYLAALIAVNLAVMNLLPLPALDGGKIFFLVLNALSMLVIRKQIPTKYENYIHFAGLILLLGLMVVITFHDVWKLFT